MASKDASKGSFLMVDCSLMCFCSWKTANDGIYGFKMFSRFCVAKTTGLAEFDLMLCYTVRFITNVLQSWKECVFVVYSFCLYGQKLRNIWIISTNELIPEYSIWM